MGLIVEEYLASDGASPYRRWLETLDLPVRARVQARVLRFELSNLGDHKALGDGVWEARLTFGPGHRIYFAKVGHRVILLLLGGDKVHSRILGGDKVHSRRTSGSQNDIGPISWRL